ncbi:hypothetical protein DdX_21625 [Ditylenchus destructor]|uniref:G protein-coupled receptor n=1 Tax=Ditylenchus destructor TaxID=166010 RepID=A0AAD4MEN0_9BILA|nr:hypothetical protein DdX_21625 [Ditylenchus destructor]
MFASTCGNFLLVAVFVKGHTQFKSVTFFVLASQMLVCDIVGLIVSFIVDVPLTFSGYLVENPISAPFPQLYIAFVDGIGAFAYVATILFATLLALNRFCIFMAPSLDRFLFRRPNIFIFEMIFEDELDLLGFSEEENDHNQATVTRATNARLFQQTVRFPDDMNPEQFLDRHGDFSLNVMVVCGPQRKIFYAKTAAPGTAEARAAGKQKQTELINFFVR